MTLNKLFHLPDSQFPHLQDRGRPLVHRPQRVMSVKDFEVQGRGLRPQGRNEFRKGERGKGKTRCHPSPTHQAHRNISSSLSGHPHPCARAAALLVRRPFSTPPSDLDPNLSPPVLRPSPSLPVQSLGPGPAPAPCTLWCAFTAPCLQRRNGCLFSPLLLDPKKDPKAKEWCFQKQLNGSQLPSARRKELALEMNTQAFHILMEGQWHKSVTTNN